MWDEIVEQIFATTGKAFRLAKASPVGGGGINEAYRLDGEGGPFFAKLNRADKLEMFEAEADVMAAGDRRGNGNGNGALDFLKEIY